MRTPAEAVIHRNSNPYLGVPSIWIFILVLMWLLGPTVAFLRGQTYQQSFGIPTFTTSLPVENGFINIANGDLHLDIQVGSFPQRAGPPLWAKMIYESSIWKNSGGSWQPSNVYSDYTQSFAGWRAEDSVGIANPGMSWDTEVATICPQDGQVQYYTISNYTWQAPDGTAHVFPIQTIVGETSACGTTSSQPNGDALANDATGYHMYVVNFGVQSVLAPNGTKVHPGPYVTDSNGNYVAVYSGYTDTVGRSLPRCCIINNNTVPFTVTNSQGGTSTYTMKLGTISVSTNFGMAGITEYSGTIQVVTEFDLPDGTKYQFGYDSGTSPGHYGLLTSMTLPTGGQINYSWSIFKDAYGNPYPYLTGMTTPAPAGTWTLAPLVQTSCSSGQVNCTQQVTIAKPSGDHEVYTFALNGGSWSGQVQYYNGAVSSANLLTTVSQCFNFVTITNGQCSYNVSSGPPATNVTKSAVTTAWPGTNINGTTEYTYDGYGNVTQKSEWNFYTGTLPASADRTTNISYVGFYTNVNILDKPSTVKVKDKNGNLLTETDYYYDQDTPTSVTGVVNHDDTNYGAGYSARGNLTEIMQCCNGLAEQITLNYYDTLGNLIQSRSPNFATTYFSYTDNYYNYSPSTPTNGYITQITKPATSGVSHVDHMQYYFGAGLPAAICGENFTSTCAYGLSAPQPDYGSLSYDSMNRPVGMNGGDGGQTTLTYGTSTPINITATTTVDSTHSLVKTAVLDGLGRTSQTQTSSPQGTIYMDTTYDSNGRTHSVSNAHYSGSNPTDGTTTYSYDGLDRVTTVTEPSGGSETHSYTPDANSIMVQDSDELGNAQNSWVDAFGRTLQVNLFPGSGVVRTLYTYDLLNNLIKVDESGTNWSNDRIRTFTYDQGSHLISVSNPEAHTITYTYDNQYDILTKVNGRGTTITYQYDALNRLTSRSYNDGVTPTANFVYDACPSGGCPSGVNPQYPIGRLVEAYTASAKMFYSYDVVGRNAEQWQCTPVNCSTGFIAFTYTHNYLGEQSSISYNGNFTMSQAYDTVARITQLTNSNSNTYNPATLVSVSQFSPIGVPTQISFGNGLAETLAFNNRFQPTQLRVYSPPSTDVLNQTFTWGDPNYGGRDNGVLWAWAASGSGTPTFSRSYNYDGLNRLTTMSSPADPSGCTGLSWTDDAWANRTNQTVTGGTCGQSSLTINTSNHVTNTGFTYDNDGNLTAGTSPYQYDAEDRITQFNNGPSNGGANYVYDANGRRIEKATSTGQVHYFYDENGHVIVETDQNGNWTKDYVYMGGQRVAEFSGGQTYFIHTDHLGSTRTVTNYASSVTDKLDYLPYGEQIAGGTFTTHKFTGYERDSESGLDYANARYYSSSLGRFMSIDPAPGDVAGPQSYNRYGYVVNNPLTLTDPTGMLCAPVSACTVAPPPPIDITLCLDCGFGDGWMRNRAGAHGYGVDYELCIRSDDADSFQERKADCSGVRGAPPQTATAQQPTSPSPAPDPGPGQNPGTGDPGPSNPGPAGPEQPYGPKFGPPTDDEYNACVAQASATRDAAKKQGRVAQAVGGIGILFGVAANAMTLPALGEEFFRRGAEGAFDFFHAGGFAYTGSFATLVPGYLYVTGTTDIINAENEYNNSVVSCAAPVAR